MANHHDIMNEQPRLKQAASTSIQVRLLNSPLTCLSGPEHFRLSQPRLFKMVFAVGVFPNSENETWRFSYFRRESFGGATSAAAPSEVFGVALEATFVGAHGIVQQTDGPRDGTASEAGRFEVQKRVWGCATNKDGGLVEV
mmetsp:Transcript_45166/g.120098  ORF Transcript_45166/g.120098 Transcript_45166/m.120098 type:complete len:141 (+) Transcript_45166:774-1196(+)